MKLLDNGDQLLLKLLLKMMRTLTLNKFDGVYMLNLHYKASAWKLCSACILINSKIMHDLRSPNHSMYLSVRSSCQSLESVLHLLHTYWPLCQVN